MSEDNKLEDAILQYNVFTKTNITRYRYPSEAKNIYQVFVRYALVGNPKALFYQALCFLDSTGVAKDENEAEKLLKVAADKKHSESYYLLEIRKIDKEGFSKYFEKASLGNSSNIQFYYSYSLYYRKKGVPVDLERGLEFIKLSKKQKNIDAIKFINEYKRKKIKTVSDYLNYKKEKSSNHIDITRNNKWYSKYLSGEDLVVEGFNSLEWIKVDGLILHLTKLKVKSCDLLQEVTLKGCFLTSLTLSNLKSMESFVLRYSDHSFEDNENSTIMVKDMPSLNNIEIDHLHASR
ncbi:27722_t:CDS:1, partial [Gigaspora margarita]